MGAKLLFCKSCRIIDACAGQLPTNLGRTVVRIYESRFLVCASGICELRVEPLYKADRPAVLFTCNNLVSTYIGESAPCRVDIGKEAEDALVKEVRFHPNKNKHLEYIKENMKLILGYLS